MAQNTHEEMLHHVQHIALGPLVEWLLCEHFKQFQDPEKRANDLLAFAEGLGEATTFPEVRPELSDLAAQEFRDTLVRHIHRAKALATGKPFDPDAFQKRVP